ncbi:MAG: MBL fold metallo-hydrolase [Candidatus Egerieousia sp.]
MITVKTFYLNELRECCHILSDETGECVIVDPGICSQSEQQRITKYISDNGLKPVKLLNTHGHFDHVMGNSFITATYNIPTYIHAADKELLHHVKNTCRMFGYEIENPSDDIVELSEKEPVTFGNSSLDVIHTPGHTWGSVCFYSENEKLCLSGDTLFAGSCGRTDLPEGDTHAMIDSLINKLVKIIKPETRILPGHGTETTMLEELAHNPYLRSSNWL